MCIYINESQQITETECDEREITGHVFCMNELFGSHNSRVNNSL